MQENLRFCG